jgi:hypothetical protein
MQLTSIGATGIEAGAGSGMGGIGGIMGHHAGAVRRRAIAAAWRACQSHDVP